MTIVIIALAFILGYILIKYWIKLINLIFKPIQKNLENKKVSNKQGIRSFENEEKLTDLMNDDKKVGEFTINDYPEKNRHNKFYFHEYKKMDGEWVEIDEPICKIRVGEYYSNYYFTSATVRASKSGVLEWTVKKDQVLNEGTVFYRLHEKGVYKNENTPDNKEYRHYFNGGDFFSHTFEWLKSDGDFVNKGDDIYQYDSKNKKIKHKAEKSGFIHIADPHKIGHLEQNELTYKICDTDIERVNERFVNEPNIIIDEFNNSKTITWKKVSSLPYYSRGIKTKSNDLLTDLTFSFNFYPTNDYIVFIFNPKQIQPKQNDKIIFLFDNGKQIEFELSNPIIFKNKLKEKVLESKSLITKSELELFSNVNFKKWKISLISNGREILGGEKGGDKNYESKSNLVTAIKKFAKEYMALVKQTIPDYQALEMREMVELSNEKDEPCFVYLMHDTTNGYYKIGISNKPKYRERTLQSEKPTIKMMESKKFPIRKIAESIEKSLHETYSDKRLRGEWFDLDETDIRHITEALK